jgi:hypothetical protein
MSTPAPLSAIQSPKPEGSFLSCARPDAVAAVKSNLFGDGEGRLGAWPGADKLPIVYSPLYNVRLCTSALDEDL